MSALAIRWLAGLAVFAAVFAAGYWRGDVARDNAWQAANAKAERAAAQQYQTEVKRGDQAVADLGSFARAQTTRYTELTGAFNELRRKRTPLVVSVAAARPAGAAGAGAPDGGGLPGLCAPDGDYGAGDSGLLLSAGAVWMWNSALAGADQPANTCGLADPTAPACAVETNITLDNAWDNHTGNAQACAENRLAHQRLIDFLVKREGAKP